MRRIGTLTDGALAQRFCQHLLRMSIDAIAACQGDPKAAWDIWIRDENDVQQARAELAEFEADPQSDRYQNAEEAVEEAESLERPADQVQADREQADRMQVDREDASGEDRHGESHREAEAAGVDRPVAGEATGGVPVTIALILISTIVSVTSNFGHPRRSQVPGQRSLEQRTFDTLSVVNPPQFHDGGDVFASLRQGQLWRPLTSMLVHADEVQLMFNMLWIFVFGAVIERQLGSLFLLLLASTSQIAGSLLQVALIAIGLLPEAMLGGPLAVGAAAAVYGMFGFLCVRPRIDPGCPNHLTPITVAVMLGWWVAGIMPLPLLEDFSSGAPVGGLIVGMAAAVAVGVTRR